MGSSLGTTVIRYQVPFQNHVKNNSALSIISSFNFLKQKYNSSNDCHYLGSAYCMSDTALSTLQVFYQLLFKVI